MSPEVFVMLLYRITTSLALSLLMSIVAIAQDTPGLIFGMIRSENGNPVSGVKTDLIQEETDVPVISDSKGAFLFYLVNPGSFEIRFEHPSASSAGIFKAVFSPKCMGGGEGAHGKMDGFVPQYAAFMEFSFSN
jgi:hypothetical protein